MCVRACVYTRVSAPLSCRDRGAAPARVNANRNANESAPINACLISYSAASGRGKPMGVSGERLLGGVHEKVQAQPLIHSLCWEPPVLRKPSVNADTPRFRRTAEQPGPL